MTEIWQYTAVDRADTTVGLAFETRELAVKYAKKKAEKEAGESESVSRRDGDGFVAFDVGSSTHLAKRKDVRDSLPEE